MKAEDQSKVITPDSPDAANYRIDIKGWVSRGGQFYGDGDDAERIARWVGCTHRPCEECGTITEKLWTHCGPCRERRRHERWLKLPVGEWDGTGMIYSDKLNEYFQDYPDEEIYGEHGPLDLVICEPVKLSQIDSEYWSDEIETEDGHADLPQHVEDAVAALNAELEKMEPVAWRPGRLRIDQP